VNPLRSSHVHAYLTLIITLGLAVLVEAVANWQSQDLGKFAAYLSLACLAGALKTRLPGMTGTYSLTFLFVLIGVMDLSLAETVFIASSSMIVQCVWRPEVKPASIQVIFNAASVSIAAAAAYFAAHRLDLPNLILQLLVAAVVYYIANTLLVSGILAQVEQRDFRKVWGEWFRLSLTYYLAGVVVAGIVVVSNRHFGWIFSLLALPLMYLEYLCYRLKIDGHRPAKILVPVTADRERSPEC
jgi:hypothetical protein